MSVIFRPPLWVQNGSYSATEDRRLTHAILRGGVYGPNDLKVVPREEGPNLSVDILRGYGSVIGTDQADQGTFLCPLGQKVNRGIGQGPAAGNHRLDYIFIKVYDEALQHDPPWDIIVVPGTPGPTNAPPPTTPTGPPSTFALATVGPIASNTTQITANMITDYRHYARLATMGDFTLKQVQLGGGQPGGTFAAWGPGIGVPIRIGMGGTARYDAPLDIEARLEGRIGPASGSGTTAGDVRIQFSRTGAPNVWHDLSPILPVTAGNFSQTFVVNNVQPRYPDVLGVQAVARTRAGYPQAAFADGTLTFRVTPSDAGMVW